ncbi:histone-lysine N-methyltransferase family member SUVH9-like [Andrographis paniculata]|uniref:histone-lysine N-methyltransferase family member SUVH9-like n=1 Tax=Andrographis paniculata TaxID=175694 RepID=UPI0021E8D439|nr:histone-lysine N-methyltransferase family member SUVH9-like [Andrographis paniculata]
MNSDNGVHFTDPNLYFAAAATAAAATAAADLFPRIEPKLEPLDEPPSPPPPSSGNPNSSSDVDLLSDYGNLSDLCRSNFAQRLQKYGDIAVLPDSDPDSRAIVPVPDPHAPETSLIAPRGRGGGRKYTQRSGELVRVTDLKPEDDRYYRDSVRKTRMLFDSLRVFYVWEDDNHRDAAAAAPVLSPLAQPPRRTRGDLRAASILRQTGLWMYREKRIVGDIPGVSVGDVFFFRIELCVVGLHGQLQAGIDYVPASLSSTREPIATSIIVSGGYEDDEDSGEVIIYTGHGGQDAKGRQVVDQKLESGNLGLERSMHYGVEIRVIRGFKYQGSVSGRIYVYDGLYRVAQTWLDLGKSGFGVYKFKLERIENQLEMGSVVMKFAEKLRSRPIELRPIGYISLDLSCGKENMPIFVFNDIDEDRGPLDYEYLPAALFPPNVYASPGGGCECVGGCFSNCSCIARNGGSPPYDANGILLRGKPLIFECGPHCRCPPTCRNRVTQKGIRYRFEVFRSRETGWGVRSLNLIPAGSFICEYSGVVLTQDKVQILIMNGDSFVHPGRFSHRWKEWGDLSDVFDDYIYPSFPLAPPLDFALDVAKLRNVACYISQSSSPNVFGQLVLYDHNNVYFPRLMLFALENIPPMREISLDYGVDDGVDDECMGKLAICS